MKSIIKTTFFLLIAVFFTLFLNACSNSDAADEKMNPESNTPRSYVEVLKLKSQNFVDYIKVIGFAKAFQSASIASEEAGKIKGFLKNKGDYVRKGETIFMIENDVLRANLDAAKSKYELAEINYQKQKKVYEENVGSEIEYLKSKYNRDIEKANYELIRSRYKNTFVKAPFSGYVDDKFIETGEFAAPGVPVVTLINIEKVKILTGVPENYANDVQTGNAVKIIFQDLNNREYNGKISFVSSSINNSNRTFAVEIIINNSDKLIKPQLSAEVFIERAKYDSVFMVPEEVVTKTDLGNIVYIEKDGVAHMERVNVLARSDNKAAIKNGLKNGDNLIVVGYQKLVDKEKVEVLKRDSQ